MWLAAHVAALLWDDEAWDVLSARFVQLARDAGALSVLPLALTTRSGFSVFAGRLTMAALLVDEVSAVNEATGSSVAAYIAPILAGFRGREAEAAPLIEAATRELVRRGEGQGLAFTHWATAVLNNGLGRYEDALAAAQQGAEEPLEVRVAAWGSVELIEAAARSGKPELAVHALGRLSQTTATSGTDWALGIEARSRALLTEGEAAEPLYRQAIEPLARTRVRVELARAHLLYGEWLRRERRRLDAREQLRHAHELFTRVRDGSVRRARPGRARGDRRARAQTDRRDARRPDAPGSTDRPPRRRRGHQPRNRRRSCSSARAPSTTTYARHSASSESNPATNSKSTCSGQPHTASPPLGETDRRTTGQIRDGGQGQTRLRESCQPASTRSKARVRPLPS